MILANAAARKVFGDELVGRRWHDICPSITDAIWQRVREAVEPLYVDARIGERDYVFAHRRDHTSSLVFIFGSDITRQKDAERMLAEVARFPEMNPGPVLRCELDSKVFLANAAARQVFGNELVGLRWRDCVAGIDNAMWNRIMQGTEPIYLEARIGEREYVFAHRRDHDGSLVFVLARPVIRTRVERGWAVVEVEDDGPGIPEAIQARIFDPFFKVALNGPKHFGVVVDGEEDRPSHCLAPGVAATAATAAGP